MKGIQDMRKSYHSMKESGSSDRHIEGAYGMWEAWSGNISKGIEVLEKHIKRQGALASAFHNLQSAHIKSGNLKAAEKVKKKGIAFIYSRKSVLSPYLIHSKAKSEFKSLEMQGKYEEAEPYIRKALKLSQSKQTFPDYTTQHFYDRNALIRNLLKQQKFVESEIEAREGIKSAMTIGGNSSFVTAMLIESLSEILIRKGRLEDAKKLCEANIQIWQNSDFPIDSWPLA
ncbi:unnamed protein product, partial [marine sediment metagenome]